MKSWSIFPAMLFCTLYLSGVRAEEAAAHSGLANANVGDWVEYIVHTDKGGTMQRRTIAAKDAKGITIKTEVRTPNRAPFSSETTIPLDKPYNPGVNDSDAKVEKLEEGDEKITVNGKAYDTHWYHYKGKSKSGAAIDGKVWISKDVALGGMVKMEATSEHGDVNMNLTKTSADK